MVVNALGPTAHKPGEEMALAREAEKLRGGVRGRGRGFGGGKRKPKHRDDSPPPQGADDQKEVIVDDGDKGGKGDRAHIEFFQPKKSAKIDNGGRGGGHGGPGDGGRGTSGGGQGGRVGTGGAKGEGMDAGTSNPNLDSNFGSMQDGHDSEEDDLIPLLGPTGPLPSNPKPMNSILPAPPLFSLMDQVSFYSLDNDMSNVLWQVKPSFIKHPFRT